MAGDFDVFILGTGFSGVYMLYKLLEMDYNVIAVDAASELGGVWRHNTYPGARVDIEVPAYSLDIEDIWSEKDGEPGWQWSERFPSYQELQSYFNFVDRRLGGLSKHCVFNTWIDKATWDDVDRLWKIQSRDGRTWTAKFFVPCVGYAANPYIPDIPGLSSFGGTCMHTAEWPREDIELTGKRVGVVGTGASGVQLVQTVAPVVKELVVFHRTPAMAIPMQQRAYEQRYPSKDDLRSFLRSRKTLYDGGTGGMILRPAKEDSEEQREQEFDRLWAEGGFAFWTANYMDLFGDKESNAIIYEYWKRHVRRRIDDPAKQEILAPSTLPYWFGTRRVPLEHSYYDVFNLKHVELVDLHKDSISRVTDQGVEMQSGNMHDLDVLVFATGFDVGTGSFTQMDIRGTHGASLKEKWKHGVKTQLGMATNGFPNMMFPYGPQSPSNLCNGPVCAEEQGNWIIRCLEHLRAQKMNRIEALPKSEGEWSAHATGLLKGSLFEETSGYYFGDNIPGKPREALFYFGGLPTYLEKCNAVAEGGYEGFDIS
ncbi:MAG: hypothetical protein Q9160_007908 [Pyrenula sp. 1 TL-2023]